MVVRTSVEGGRLRAGDIVWSPATRQIQYRGELLRLPRRAEECLVALMEARGALVGKEELQQRIWGGALREESSLAQTVVILRKALDPAPGGGSYIDTVSRHGYRMALEVVGKRRVRRTGLNRWNPRGAGSGCGERWRRWRACWRWGASSSGGRAGRGKSRPRRR